MARYLFVALLGLASCGDDVPATSSPFSSSVSRVEFEVDYAPEAPPYTFSLLTGGSTWGFLRNNLTAAYEGLDPQIVLPESLDDMQRISLVSKASYSVDDIVAIADANRQTFDTETSRAYYVLFLDGVFQIDGADDPEVIGVSIGNTGIIAMFKPVYDNQLGASFVEPTTIFHEWGHAVGLVNRGIALTSDHHDAEHGAHCTNADCVMYWRNEGLGDLANFIRRFVFGDDSIILGPECLADLRAEIQKATP